MTTQPRDAASAASLASNSPVTPRALARWTLVLASLGAFLTSLDVIAAAFSPSRAAAQQ